MEKFFEVLKNEIKYEEKLKKLLPYYATLRQAVDLEGFIEMLNDIKNKDYTITYIEEKEDDWYSNGKFIVYFNDNYDYEYVIKLKQDSRDWGYCTCAPNMNGYDPIHDCCGNGCDYTFPEIEISKVDYKVRHAYNGIARQLWDDLLHIEVEFSEVKVNSEKLHKERQKKALQEQIELLHKQLEELND